MRGCDRLFQLPIVHTVLMLSVRTAMVQNEAGEERERSRDQTMVTHHTI
jgi:hypothetical protein